MRTCVLHPYVPAVEVCIIRGHLRAAGVVRDFCAECIEASRDDYNFGRCYECADGNHARCIGVPCQCECPPMDLDRLAREIADAEDVVTRLKSQWVDLFEAQRKAKAANP